MKKWIFAIIFIGLSFASKAQYNADSYFSPNWYIGASAGLNSYWGEDYKTYMTFEPQKSFGFIGRASAGYNFTPIFGLCGSLGYTQHNWPNENSVPPFEARNLTMDLTVDITNWWTGYNVDNKFNLVVFGGTGAGYRYNVTDSIGRDLTFILRGGLQGKFHLSKTVDLNLTGETNIVRDEYNDQQKRDTPVDMYPAFTVGISYHFKADKYKKYTKKKWNPHTPKWGK